MKRRSLAGSLIGGIRETQEMLDFCGRHGVSTDVEVIPIQEINRATSACSRMTCAIALLLTSLA
jgi:D-arabinose 1-dehydrogenase-like Zn-dependent alcohol dehydrogenase